MYQLIIPNDVFRDAMTALVNGWFRKWRDRDLSDADWNHVIEELGEVGKKYPYEIVSKVGIGLLEEIERRDKARHPEKYDKHPALAD